MPRDDPAHEAEADALSETNGQPETAAAPLDGPAIPRRRSRLRLRSVLLGVVMGSAIGLAGMISLVVFLNRGQLPIMQPAELKAAEQRWRDRGPASYTMDLEGSFDIKGHMHVEVRNGEVTAMSLDGRPSPPRIWNLWSANGLFDFIETDLKRNTDAVHHEGGPLPEPVLQQAVFDPELGLPRAYQRTELASGQSGGWTIVKFEGVER
jgi:uncharacterized protein DUF6174